MKILVVDDNEGVRRVLARTLKHMGHAVQSASSYREGLRRLRELTPEVLVTDLELGDGFGSDLIRMARLERLDTHCILITANSGFVIPDDLAGTQLLSKPCGVEDLAAALEPPAVVESVVYASSRIRRGRT